MNANIRATSGDSRGHRDYWDDRATKSYLYNGERFYTITPIPLYVRRRSELIKILSPYIGCDDGGHKNVLDYGCGEGWHLEYFAKTYPCNSYFGTDISEQMMRLHKKELCMEAASRQDH